MRKPSLLPPLLLYVAATVAFLFLLFLFLDTQGFGWRNFWIGLGIFVPAIAAVGYLLLSDALEGKRRQDARLEHLTREILHEITLPISTIEANTALLQRTATDAREQKRLVRIHASLLRLRRLYDELSYNIRREIHAVSPEKFDIVEMVQERVAVYEEMGRNSFETTLASCNVLVDRIGLEQTLDNIVENAMKYSDAHQPVTLAIVGSCLRITDRGIGMDATQVARIYERYYQGDNHNPGEGIGLALVKRYCDEARIGIRIDSVPGSGTTVILDLDNVIQK